MTSQPDRFGLVYYEYSYIFSPVSEYPSDPCSIRDSSVAEESSSWSLGRGMSMARGRPCMTIERVETVAREESSSAP